MHVKEQKWNVYFQMKNDVLPLYENQTFSFYYTNGFEFSNDGSLTDIINVFGISIIKILNE